MLKGKCALITGSTQGLGYAMAERLAGEGCNVVLNGFGDSDEIESRRRRLEDSHGVRASRIFPTIWVIRCSVSQLSRHAA